MKLARVLSLSLLSLFAFSFLFLSQASGARAADTDAMVRVVHASPAAGTVDVFVDGKALLTKFEFAKVTDYVAVPAGSHTVKVAPAGKGIDAAVITQDVSVDANMAYTVAAIGTKDSGFGLTAFNDDNASAGNQAKVRVYHLSPDAGPVNVATGGNNVINGLEYKNASDYLMVPAKKYTFDVTATDSNAKVSVDGDLKAGTVTSVFALGLLKGDPKLQFAAAQVTGNAGMPQTGSDPNAGTNWALVGSLLVIGLLGAGTATRVAFARSK